MSFAEMNFQNKKRAPGYTPALAILKQDARKP